MGIALLHSRTATGERTVNPLRDLSGCWASRQSLITVVAAIAVVAVH